MTQEKGDSNVYTFAAQPQAINAQLKKFREPYQELMYIHDTGKSHPKILCAIEG